VPSVYSSQCRDIEKINEWSKGKIGEKRENNH